MADGTGASRLLPLVGTLLVIALTFAAQTWIEGGRLPVVPPTGAVTLEGKEAAVTDWVEVPARSQARYEWDAGFVLNFDVEVWGGGIIEGGVRAHGRGCARAVEPFAIRIAWGNYEDTIFGWQTTTVNYRVVVEAADNACPTLAALRQANATLSPRVIDVPRNSEPFQAGAVGNLAFCGLVLATWWPRRHEWREASRQTRFVDEWWLQARERWVEEQVRLRGGCGP